MIDVDGGLPNPEVYMEKPVLFRTESTGAILYGMEEYRAGQGNQPAVGDEMVLSVPGLMGYTHRDGKRVDVPCSPMLEGVYAIVDVRDGEIDSPFVNPTEGDSQFWGVVVKKVRDIEHEDEIDRVEKAGLLSMI